MVISFAQFIIIVYNEMKNKSRMFAQNDFFDRMSMKDKRRLS